MKVCFPITANNGLASVVHGHFGSSPYFLFVDSQTLEFRVLAGADPHAGGGCNPLAVVSTQEVEAVVVGGIGGGAYNGLKRGGIAVYSSQAESVMENLALIAVGKLPEWSPDHGCGHHHLHGHGCGHHGHDHGHDHGGHGNTCGHGGHGHQGHGEHGHGHHGHCGHHGHGGHGGHGHKH